MDIINFDNSIIRVCKGVWGDEKTMDKSALKEINKFLNCLGKKLTMTLNSGQQKMKFKSKRKSKSRKPRRKSRSRRKTLAEKRAECKEKGLVYDNKTKRCRKSRMRSKRRSLRKSRARSDKCLNPLHGLSGVFRAADGFLRKCDDFFVITLQKSIWIYDQWRLHHIYNNIRRYIFKIIPLCCNNKCFAII